MHLVAIIEFLKQVDELVTARQLLDTFSKYSNSLQQYDELGMLYEKVKAYDRSVDMLNKCIAIASSPQELYSIRSNLSKVHNHLNQPDKSLQYSGINLAMNPEDNEAMMEQSFSYYLKGNYDKSYQIQSDLLSKPISKEVANRINFNMGTFEMQRGKFKSGIKKMIMGGKAIGIWPSAKTPYPDWDGKSTDKTILVHAEAGIGDELVNVRFLREIEKRGMKYIYMGFREDLVNIFRRNGYNAQMKNVPLDPMQEYVFCTAMTLPILLELDKNELWNGPYLKPSETCLKQWKERLPDKFITVKWCGNPFYDHDLHRIIDINSLMKELNQFDIPVYSLSLDYDNIGHPLIGLEEWEDTLAIQYLATLNITSCTSTAHSASAIGAKCIVMPPISTYYPWLDLKENMYSNWYSENTKVFVQTKHKDWTEPISRVVKELHDIKF